jgi:hypothetical protein
MNEFGKVCAYTVYTQIYESLCMANFPSLKEERGEGGGGLVFFIWFAMKGFDYL